MWFYSSALALLLCVSVASCSDGRPELGEGSDAADASVVSDIDTSDRDEKLHLKLSEAGMRIDDEVSPSINRAVEKSPPWLTEYPPVAASWYNAAADKVQRAVRREGRDDYGRARNIILFVGDGMGISTVTAARIYAGQQLGQSGEEYELAFDLFPYTGLARTYNTDMQTPDSAGTITALMAGVKTKAGVLNINDEVIRGNCDSSRGNELFSLLDIAEFAGLATGIVSTARITHATPAGAYAKSANRDWESDARMPTAEPGFNCTDIAQQLVEYPSRIRSLVRRRALTGAEVNGSPRQWDLNYIDGPEVILGGGLSKFLPLGETRLASGKAGRGERRDGRNLIAEWLAQNPNGVFVDNREEFTAASATQPEKMLGLFSDSHMAYAAAQASGGTGQPSLTAMTEAAIRRLAAEPGGYFLMVEAARIDHAHHDGNAYQALNDTVELSRAVAAAAALTDERDTLIIVTADHSHVLTMAGYPKRGNPILGKVHNGNLEGKPQLENAADGKPYTTLSYANGRTAFKTHNNGERIDLTDVDTTSPDYHQQALVPLVAETHGGEDVGIYARGPAAYLVSGSHEQNVIFHIMNYAGALLDKAQAKLLTQAKLATKPAP